MSASIEAEKKNVEETIWMKDNNPLTKDSDFRPTAKDVYIEGSSKTIKKIIIHYKSYQKLDGYQQGNSALCTRKIKQTILMEVKVALNRKILSKIVSQLKVIK